MGHTNETTNYELTQFLGTDKPAWLVDYNGDNLKIDAAMKAISDVADAAKTKADNNETAISSVTTTANAADARSQASISNTADTYDPTSTYVIGDLSIYNNLLYRCTTSINVPEAFDGTKWTRTTLEELRNSIESEIDTLNNDLTEKANLIIVKRVTHVVTVNNGTNFSFEHNVSLSDYTLRGIVGYRIAGGLSLVDEVYIHPHTSTINYIQGEGKPSDSGTVTLEIWCLYEHN